MVRDVLQGRKPTYNHLTEVEIGMLEVFELTKNTKATEEICIDTTKEDFQIYKKVKKKTCSSISQLQFRHYKAAALKKTLSESHAKILHIVNKLGQSLSQLIQLITVILEKNKVCILVKKLGAILLMAAAFNMVKKLFI